MNSPLNQVKTHFPILQWDDKQEHFWTLVNFSMRLFEESNFHALYTMLHVDVYFNRLFFLEIQYLDLKLYIKRCI